MAYLLESVPFQKETWREAYRSNPDNAMSLLWESINDGETRLGESVTLSQLWETCTGTEWTPENVYKMYKEEDFVGVKDFRLATSQLIWRAVDERMLQASFIGDQLFTPRPTQVLGVPEKALYFSTPIEDNSVPKKEGEENSFVQTVNGYYECDPPEEYRIAIAISERVLLADRSGGRAIDYAYSQLNGLRIAREKRQLGYALGTNYQSRSTVWKWGQESKDTPNTWNAYNSTTGGPTSTVPPYINSLTGASANPLLNHNSINQILVKWSKFTDPMSGTLVQIPMNLTMVVPYALDMTAEIIRTMTNIQVVDNQASPNTLRFTAPNPLNGRRINFTVLTSQYVSVLTGNDTTWYLGDFREAFERNYVYEWRTMDLIGSIPKFNRNIEVARRVDYMENYNTRYPLVVFKNAAT